MSESRERAGAVFDAAVELPPEERAAIVEQACGGDAALRRRVEALLKAHEVAGTFMVSPAQAALPETMQVPAPEQSGEWIGRYKLLQQIGEGGCGVVYMAEQEEPIRRRVALKVIKLGMDTLDSVNGLAGLLCKKGDTAGAEPLCRRALEGRERKLGKQHPDTVKSRNLTIEVLTKAGKPAEAEALRREAKGLIEGK